MFLTRKNDVIVLDDGCYMVLDQVEYNGQEYVILMSVTGNFKELITQNAPVFVAKEIISEDGEDFYLDFIEDQKIIKEVSDLYEIEK